MQVIGGSRGEGSSGQQHEVINPATGETVERFQAAGAADADRAVAAATAAYQEWSRATPVERSTVIAAWADRLDERAEELARRESLQTGKPIRLTTGFDVPGSIDNVRFFAGAARHLSGLATGEYSGDHTSGVRREPIGVVGSIAPWNYPLQMAMWKVLPAIAAGNTIVLKPAENTPLTSVDIALAAKEAGLPDGVVNVLTGPGRLAGEALMAHPGVSMVSFTGSTGVGRRVMEVCSQAPKRVHLELGGKAPFVVFDDADLEAAVHGAVAGSLINTGQDCTAATRAYVQRPLYEAFVAGVADLMAAIRLGDPLDPDTDLGPLISRRQQDSVAGFVTRAVADGATVKVGGQIPGGELARGSYYRPTLVVDAAQHSEIVQEEIFGPVLVVLPFDDDDEAFRLANDSPYGLASSAWTTSHLRAQRATREIAAGCVWVNDHIPIISEMPHGGFKSSGFGKDMSVYSFEEYTQVKHIMSDITGVARKPWHRTIFTDRTA